MGNITKFRDMDFLLDFTKNSQRLISTGHNLAVCLYEQWDKVLMNSFEHLPDEELMNIYKFIVSESRNLEIRVDEVIYIDSCEISNRGFIAFDSTGNAIDSNSNGGIIPDSQISRSLEYYEFDVSEYGWYNIDRFLGQNFEKIENIKITVDNIKNVDLLGFVIFVDRNIIIPLDKHEDYYVLRYGEGKEVVEFPLNEKLQAVFIETTENEELYFGTNKFTSKLIQNVHHVNLSKMNSNEIAGKLN